MYCSQTSLDYSEFDSSSRSTSSLNLFGLALKRLERLRINDKRENEVDFFSRGLHKANKRLSRAFSFSPEPNKSFLKKTNSPIQNLQDEWANTLDTSKRMSIPPRQVDQIEIYLTRKRKCSLFDSLGIVCNNNASIRFIAIYAINTRTYAI